MLFGKWNVLSRESETREQNLPGGKGVCGKQRMQKEIFLWQRATAVSEHPPWGRIPAHLQSAPEVLERGAFISWG